MPRPFIVQQILLPLLHIFSNKRRHTRFITELRDRREQGFKVEDDGCGEGEAAEGLPIYAEMTVGELEVGGLICAVDL